MKTIPLSIVSEKTERLRVATPDVFFNNWFKMVEGHKTMLVMIVIDKLPMRMKDENGVKNPYWRKVYRYRIIKGYVCQDIESLVNAQREKEGKKPNFSFKHDKWKKKTPNSALRTHRGQTYLDVTEPVLQKVLYFDNIGKRFLNEDELLKFTKPQFVPKQGLDNDVEFSYFPISSIHYIKIDNSKTVFELKHE